MARHVGPAASVVVRTRDAAATLAAAVHSVRAQTVPVEVVVVDSGSTDGTVALARRLADVVLQIPAERFSYGRALNIGAAHAGCPVGVALSAHCRLPRTDWVERVLRHLEDPRVAAVCGLPALPGTPPHWFVQTESAMLAAPYVGVSNHASAWRVAVVRELPFDETMAASEDREWALRVARSGWKVVLDPELYVDGGHRRAPGLLPYYRRLYRESAALAAAVPMRPWTLVDAGRELWRPHVLSPTTRWRAMVSRTHVVEVAARYLGERAGARRGAPR